MENIMNKNRSCLLPMAALSLSLAIVGCDDPADAPEAEGIIDEVVPAPVANTVVASIDLASIASRIGGLRMVVGQFGVELRPQASGVLKAVVSDGAGDVVEGAEVEVSMQGKDGQPHTVTLSWDVSASAYLGTMAGAAPAAGAATVKVSVNGNTAEVTAEAVNVAAAPTYGGHVVLLGDMAAEVRAEADGVVFVTAQRPSGPIGADADVEMKVTVTGEGGASIDCPLAWDPPTAGFVGVLPEGTILASGSLELTATIDGVEHLAGLSEVSVTAPAHDGDVIAVGDLSVELVPAADGKLDAYVTDASGVAVTAGADVTLEIAGAETPTVLVWDDGAGSYKGEVAADVDISTAPMVLVVNHQGRARRGGIAVAAGRALGVTWRARVAAGAGGAIPPGQAMHLASNVELRGRIGVDVAVPDVEADVEADVEVAVSAMRGRSAAAMANAQANAEAARAQAAAANAHGQAAQARGQAERVRVNAAAAQRTQVNVRTPGVPRVNVSAMGSAGAMGNASSMGNASAMGNGASAGGSVSVMIGF
ncbi:MAG: hypothetical protein DRJ42_26030 [Deltaproteobacteria bacterium]|nr:MAG: hypothetical protein DRJ42_26030 [Deltaproteobacteria bacterium]